MSVELKNTDVPVASLVQLEFEENRMICDLKNGAAISHLTLQGAQKIDIISPQPGYHFESSLLFPFPNRLANGQFTFEGKTYKFPCNDFGQPNALHGLVHDREFILRQQGQDSSGAWVTVQLSYTGSDSFFPFPFDLSVTYMLKSRALEVTIIVNNMGEGDLPFGLGWHPYFNLPQRATNSALRLPPSSEIMIDAQMIPTGKKLPSTCFDSLRSLKGLTLDTCFEVKKKEHSTTLIQLNDEQALEVWQDEHYPYIQVFTPEDGHTIAIEPMSCGIDALNSKQGIHVLTPKQTMTFCCGVNLV